MSSSRRNKNLDNSFYHDDPDYLVESKPKKLSPMTLVIVAIVGTFFIQNTLAANISLNSGGRVEFGQGIQMTTACSGTTQIMVTPNETFTNAAGAGSFKFSSITISNVPSSCHGSDFTINAYDNSGNTPLALFNSISTSAVIYNDAGTFKAGVGSTGMSVTTGSGTFTATFDTPVALASSVSKITLQSGPTGTLVYAVGQTGPGGGTVFYVANTPFACGPTLAKKCYYLEAALTSVTNAWSDVARTWSTGGNQSLSVVDATGIVIGTGYKNSLAIAAQTSNVAAFSAAVAARGYAGPNNLSDWFLPSRDELNELYIRRTNVGGFVDSFYWSSSESAAYSAWNQDFFNGYQSFNLKNNTYYVRPVRAF